MGVIGFNFTKMIVEKKEGTSKGKISISNNVNISSVEELDIKTGIKDQTGLKFGFEFLSKYDPNIGKIQINGEVVHLGNADEAKKIVAEWKKNKKLSPDVAENVMNTILSKCHVEALILSRDINLPPPVQLPKITSKK